MKKPVVDYREFRISKLNTPQFSHMKLAIFGWLFDFSFYFLTENLIPAEICHPIHCALDDLIPFCEYFAVFYVFWYLLVFGSLIYTLLYDTESFTRLSKFILITQVIAMTVYILYPSRQDLRPEVFVRDNFLSRLMAFIYSFDTPTGVFPSLHVAYSMGILSVALKMPELKKGWKWALGVVVVLICLATAFVKQHSMLDVFAALPVSLVAEALVYWGDYWKPRLQKKKE
jgi:membrane-associated phospholipid phosphatase